MDTCYDVPLAILKTALEETKGALGMIHHPRPYDELFAEYQDIEGAIRHLEIIKAGGARNIISMLHSIVAPVVEEFDQGELAAASLAKVYNLAETMKSNVRANDQMRMITDIGDMVMCLISLSIWAKVPLETCLLAAYDEFSTVSTQSPP